MMLEHVERLLDDKGYSTCRYNGCFDIVARKRNLLLLKLLKNVDSLMKSQANNLKIISNNLDANPVLIGEHTSVERLKNGIVYERFEIPTVSVETFENLIVNEIFPKFYRDRGGMYVEADPKILRAAR